VKDSPTRSGPYAAGCRRWTRPSTCPAGARLTSSRCWRPIPRVDDPDAARTVTGELSRVKDDVDELDGLARRLSDVEVPLRAGAGGADESFEAELVHGRGHRRRDLAISSCGPCYSASTTAGRRLRGPLGGGRHDAQGLGEMNAADVPAVGRAAGGSRWRWRRVHRDRGGSKSATFIVRGRYATGLLSAEKGVHRLVRISPFDSQSRRHTAFASRGRPLPEDLSGEVDITRRPAHRSYRSSGAGGQHVNVTDSEVRITHTHGHVVSCQNQRSQHQNKDVAMKILAAKAGPSGPGRSGAGRWRCWPASSGGGWGSQIRS